MPDELQTTRQTRRALVQAGDGHIVIETDDGGNLRRSSEFITLIEGPDLYSAKRPKWDVWGSGVTKIIAALGFKATPMVVSPKLNATGDGIELREGRRIYKDPESGVPTRIEVDVRLTGRHPANGTKIDIIATGQIDLHHLLMQAFIKKAGDGRSDVCRVITTRVKERMAGDTKHDDWAFYPYGAGTWIAANVMNATVRQVLESHREQARTDKALGFATSKAVRLALKQANVVPMSFTQGQLGQKRDNDGRYYGPMFYRLLINSWVECEPEVGRQASIDAMMEKGADALDASWETVDDDANPDDANMVDEMANGAPQIEEQAPDYEAEREQLEDRPEVVEAKAEEPRASGALFADRPPAEPGPELGRAQKLVAGFEADPDMAAAVVEGRELLGFGKTPVADLTDAQAEKLMGFLTT